MKEVLCFFDNNLITRNKLINKKYIAIKQNWGETQHFTKWIKPFPDRCFSIGEFNFILADIQKSSLENDLGRKFCFFKYGHFIIWFYCWRL